MSEDWNTKYGTRRVRRDPPTLDEAIFAAIGITDDQEAQAEIMASLMGLPIEAVQAEIEESRPHGGTVFDTGDRGRARRPAFRRSRAPRDQEVRQRQAHRSLTRVQGKPPRLSHSPDRRSADSRIQAPLVRPFGPNRTFAATASSMHDWKSTIARAAAAGAAIANFRVKFAVAALDRCFRWTRRAGMSDAHRTCWQAPASPGSAPRW